jgi:lipopolysaccharide transport system ATP-binding protein
MKPAIRTEHLSKFYAVGQTTAGSRNITEMVRNSVAGVGKKLRALTGTVNTSGHGFWAVNDVGFEIQPGEAVGVIGRNGAGKSTLFKLLSRITEPTKGRIEIRGRLGSLLEVGTGFHQELTGRENIYLAGSILGMTRREINAKFKPIVDFAEIDNFLDTPVKRYSSGMYVRLAFGVIAHLEPEILIVDEVLAVGDAPFQKRCIDRMTQLTQSGKTILFVSHNMQQIPRLCTRAIMLERGKLIQEGTATEICTAYMDRLLKDARSGDLREKPRTGDGRAKFVNVQLVDTDCRPLSVFTCGDDMIIRVTVEASVPLEDVGIMVVAQTLEGLRVISGWTKEIEFPVNLKPGEQTLQCRIQQARIRPGQTIMFALRMELNGNGALLDQLENVAVYDVVDDERHHHLSANPDQGAFVCDYEWSVV